MYHSQRTRKYLKPDQRARIWSHGLKQAALGLAGQGLSQSLRGLPARCPTEADIRSWLAAPAAHQAYLALWERVRACAEDRRPQSVGQGDCFALFALTHAIGAAKGLEIGTHLGYSTLHIAAALAGNGHTPSLTTVDIIDVNDENAAPYKAYGASLSARQRLQALGLADRVSFAVARSEAFLKRTRETYDVVFIDGDHSEVGAYFDIVQSLARLSERGIVILHDYNDPADHTPGLPARQFGVHWAIHRLRAHIPDIGVVRLRSVTPPGEAPVPTTLAVLTRSTAR